MIIVGLTVPKSEPCDTGYSIAPRIMLAIFVLLIVRAVIHLVMILTKSNNLDFNRITLSTSALVLSCIYYGGCIYCGVVFYTKSQNCFQGKYSIFNTI